MEENNVKLYDANAVFIPENMDKDVSDFTEYKVCLFRVVPDNCSLVTVNTITGEIANKGGSGLKFTIPYVQKSILVPSIERVIDYPRGSYLTLDHITAGIDVALNVKIVNPAKYIKNGKYQLDQLSVLVQSLLRVYVQSLNFSAISRGSCELDEFDPNSELRAFESRSGIKVNGVLLKEVKLPADLQKQYDDAIEAQKRRETQRIDLEAKKDEALARREIAKVDADVYAMKYERFISALKEQGVPVNGIAELIKTQMISENANASFFVGDNDTAKTLGAGIAAGNSYTRSLKK